MIDFQDERVLQNGSQRPGLAAGWVFVAVSAPMRCTLKKQLFI